MPNRPPPFWLTTAHAGLVVLLDLILFYGWFAIADPQRLFLLDQPQHLPGRYMMTGLVAGGIVSFVYLSVVVGLRLTFGRRYVHPPSHLVWGLLLGPTVVIVFVATTMLARPPALPGIAGMISATLLSTHGLALVTAVWAAYAMTRLGITTGQSAIVLVVMLAALALIPAVPAEAGGRPLILWPDDLSGLLVSTVAVIVGGLGLALLGRLVPALELAPQWWQISIMTWSWYYLGGPVVHYFTTIRMASAESLMPATLGQFLVLLLVPLGVPWLGRAARRWPG